MDLVLHIGAHRTGSRAIGGAIEANQAALRRDGVSAWLHNRLRATPDFPGVTQLCQDASNGDADARSRLTALTDRLGDDYYEEAEYRRRLVLLSEENIIGTMRDNISTRSLYLDLPRRLAAYASILPVAPRRIALGIRSYETLWLSVYMFLLVRHPMPRFGTIRDDLVWSLRGWLDVVAEIRTAFPTSELLIFRQEHLRKNLSSVIAGITGYDLSQGFVTPGRETNLSISPAMADLVFQIRNDTPGLSGPPLLAALEAQKTRAMPSLPIGFSDDHVAVLKDRYRREIKALGDFGRMVRIVRVDRTEGAGE